MATFPSDVVAFPTLIDLVDSVLASHQNERADEITAIQDYLINTLLGPEGFGLNYRISVSVSSNNLTLNIKRHDNTDPSVDNPLVFRINHERYSLTSAISFTKNAATNWMSAGSGPTVNGIGGNVLDLFVYAIAETGASAGLKFGYSRIPYANTMGDFVNTNTDERYIAGNWTNFNSSDVVRVIGRFAAQLSVTSFNWSLPTPLIVNRPIWETDWRYYSPDATGVSAQDATQVWRYKINQREATVFGRHNANLTSNAASFTVPLPISCRTGLTQNMAWSGTGLMIDNTSVQSIGIIRILNTAPTAMNLYKDSAVSNNWTTGGVGKRCAQMSPMLFEI